MERMRLKFMGWVISSGDKCCSWPGISKNGSWRRWVLYADCPSILAPYFRSRGCTLTGGAIETTGRSIIVGCVGWLSSSEESSRMAAERLKRAGLNINASAARLCLRRWKAESALA